MRKTTEQEIWADLNARAFVLTILPADVAYRPRLKPGRGNLQARISLVLPPDSPATVDWIAGETEATPTQVRVALTGLVSRNLGEWDALGRFVRRAA